MTAALLLTIELARSLNGRCQPLAGRVLASDGSVSDDCSSCRAECGDWKDFGMADAGFRITNSHDGLVLNWNCPACGRNTTEATVLFLAASQSKAIAADPLCAKCRAPTTKESK